MFDRRTLLKSSVGLLIASRLARAEAALLPQAKAKNLILLWMTGGPSQLDTFDPKSGVETAGPFASIESAVSGIRISEHLPNVAKQMKQLALIRSMSSAEGNHVRATHFSLTGYLPGGIKYPTIGSVVTSMIQEHGPLPNFVSIGQGQLSGGFLGAEYASFNVRNAGHMQEMMMPSVPDTTRLDRRLALIEAVDRTFAKTEPALARDHGSMRKSAVSLMRSEQKSAFDLRDVPEKIRTAYGDTPFGRSALVARRLLDVGVRVVQVEMGGWDTHVENFTANQKLCAELDLGMSALIAELAASGRLSETLVVWMGEFGRTPKINKNNGRDHFPHAYTVALAGGGIRGGQVVGSTSHTGEEIADRPVKVPELLATIYHCLGIPPDHRLGEPRGRPISAVPDDAKPIAELV